jgi:serine/threonine-protein kinase
MAQLTVSENDGEQPSTDASPKSPGARVSKYHILMELGRGGTAIVYAAMARGIGGFTKLVVLKMTRQELGNGPEAVRMFLNEARLSARMNHPNVVQVYEVYEDDGLPVIVMEYLEGQPLSAVLRRSFTDPQYSVNLALSVLCKALEGLHYAHSLTDFNGRPLKLIHRDVTPHNVMMTYDGQVKLVDFGIAKLDAGSGHTKTGIIKGKLGYMPREQVDGTEVDCRTDVFAIGVMIWEAVAQRRMWGTLNDATVIKHLLCDEVPSLRQAKPDVDAELEAICSKALAPNPDDRYGSAHELLVALQGYLQTRGGVAAQAALAAWVNRTCADLKAESRQRLDRELAKFSAAAGGSWAEVPVQAAGRAARGDTMSASHSSSNSRRRGRAPLDTGTGTGYVGQTGANPSLTRPRRWPLVVGGALAVGLLIAWRGTVASTSPVSTAQPPIAAAAADPALLLGQPPASSVKLVIRAEPAEATLYLDGVRLPSNPYSGTRAADAETHELRVEADGFVAMRRSLRLETDAELTLALTAASPENVEADPDGAANDVAKQAAPERQHTKKARGSGQSSKQAALPAAKAPTPSTAKPPVGSEKCTTPYYSDASGIKRYKRECFSK